MPRLDKREQQAHREERLPIGDQNARLAKFENAPEKSGGQDQEGDLDTPENQIEKP